MSPSPTRPRVARSDKGDGVDALLGNDDLVGQFETLAFLEGDTHRESVMPRSRR